MRHAVAIAVIEFWKQHVGVSLGDIAGKRFRVLWSIYRSVVCLLYLSVSHVHALCSNGRRYRHDFFPTTEPSYLLVWSTSPDGFC